MHAKPPANPCGAAVVTVAPVAQLVDDVAVIEVIVARSVAGVYVPPGHEKTEVTGWIP